MENQKTLRDEAQEYEPEKLGNVADLEVIPADIPIKVEPDAEFPYKYVEVEGKRYRIPNQVINQVKSILAVNPKTLKFSVKKTGQGIHTNYTTIPLA